mgnify:CR=1 FL=1
MTSLNERTTINFNRGKIITAIVIGLILIVFSSYCLLDGDNTTKAIFIFLILVSTHILIFHALVHLRQLKRGKPGLEFDNNGIWNNTADTPVFIPWSEVEAFQTGFYRANKQIFIKVSNPDKYHLLKRSAYLAFMNRIGRFFRSKPDLLWIDVNLLDTSEKQLLSLLHSKWNEVKAGQA